MDVRTGILLILGFLSGCAPVALEEDSPWIPAPGHWPQWRGPNRDNVSSESGLLKTWPEGGPPLLWKAAGAGDGVGPVSVAGGMIFVLGSKENKYFLTTFDGTGRLLWERPVGPKTGEYAMMRYLGQCAPTVDDDRVYVVTAQGVLRCMKSSNGDLVWEKEYSRDLTGKLHYMIGYRESPLVDGDRLICAPGGPQGTLAALNKRTGTVIWRSRDLKDPMPQSSIVAAELNGVRQYVVFTMSSLAGIRAKDGALLWRTPVEAKTQIATTPIVHDSIVLITAGYSFGGKAFKIGGTPAVFTVDPLYECRQVNSHRGVTRLGDYFYAGEPGVRCFEFRTGKQVGSATGQTSTTPLIADGSVLVRGGFRKQSLSRLPAGPGEGLHGDHIEFPELTGDSVYSQMVVAGGRLYVRDLDMLYCYDLRAPDYREPPPVWTLRPEPPARPAIDPEPGNDAAFVATPHDVAEKMLEVARVTRDDLVYDLGSGDGRIVIAAASTRGCRAVGFEIEPGLVDESRRKVKEAGLSDRVRIESKNLFDVDLRPASVITLYLGAANNGRLLPRLRQLKPGTRIVSHAHLLGDDGPKPEMYRISSGEDGQEHTIYLWTVPFSTGGK